MAADTYPAGSAIQRVAIIVASMPPGGKERVVFHLATGLAARGIKPLVVCLEERGEFGERLADQGVAVEALGSRWGWDFVAIGRLARLLRGFRPDIINVHDRASLPYAFAANRLSIRAPLVVSCHGLLFQDLSHPRHVERLAMRDVRRVTAVSAEAAREYARLLAWSDPVDIVLSGVPMMPREPDLGRAVREELGLPPQMFVFLAVGNVVPEKGYEDLLDAAARLRGASAGQFIILVAGSQANKEYWQRLAAQCEHPGLGKHVRFLGQRRDTPALYATADAFVLPSRKEGLPMVLLEAMAAGLPCVATAVGGVPDAVEHGHDAMLVPPACPEDLAKAMLDLMGNPQARQKLGALARHRVETTYSVAHMVAGYLNVYGCVAGESAGGRDAGAMITHIGPRVLMLGPLPPSVGGMETVLENLQGSSLARQCQLTVLNNGKTTPEGRPFVAGAAAQAGLAGHIAANILRHRPQLVHIHTCSGFTFWRDTVHLAVARLLWRRVIWHIHGGKFEEFLASLGSVRRRLARAALQSAAAVVVLGEDWVARLEPFAPGATWRIVANGVPLPRDDNRSSEGTFAALSLANLEPGKGPRDLVSAVALAQRNGFAGEVLLAGRETEPGQKDDLLKHIAACGCDGLVRFLGVVTGPDKEAAFRRANCFVLPSYAEGLPMAMLEAMAHGLPVIVTRVGAIPEVVTDGVEGFLIEPGDVAALADRLLRLASDADLRSRMGLAARRRVEAGYSLDRMVEGILAVYREILGQESR